MANIRLGFVSNSSSSSFIITNKSDKDLTLADFVEENKYLLNEYIEQYSWNPEDEDFKERYTHDNMLYSARERGTIFEANTSKETVFGDEQGDLIGVVYDYILRNGGESKNFKWRYHEALR